MHNTKVPIKNVSQNSKKKKKKPILFFVGSKSESIKIELFALRIGIKSNMIW